MPETTQTIYSRVGFWQFSCYINICNSSGLLLQVSLKGQPTPPYPSCSHWRAVAMGHRPPPKSPDFWELLTLESSKSTHVELGRISLSLSQSILSKRIHIGQGQKYCHYHPAKKKNMASCQHPNWTKQKRSENHTTGYNEAKDFR